MTPLIGHAILLSMSGGDGHPHCIELLVNYWEIRPTLMGARLNELLKRGVTHVATFIPWQAVESDISHMLARFLQAVAERKMTVSLILSPEVGVHYANSGLPKDIFNKPDSVARHFQGEPISVHLPPNAFALPSLSAPEFAKRYHNFLSRIDNLLAEIGRNQPELLEGVNAVLTGSFWKYYRAPVVSCAHAFFGVGGDYSGAPAVSYRQRMDQYFSQREFADPTPAASNRWKSRNLEPVNRRWFNQHCEDVFRTRSTQFVRKKAHAVNLSQMELFTPEADVGYSYTNFLQMVAGAHADFSRLSSLIEHAATRASQVGEATTQPYIHWTSLGGFHNLTDSEKQFLILKSLLLMGARSGGVLIDESVWFGLSPSFRSRAEALGRMIQQGELKLKTQALYLSSHLWSGGGSLWDELLSRVGVGTRLVASMDYVLADREAKLVIVDPTLILTKELVKKLLSSARSGRIVAIPRSALYTESARAELEASLVGTTAMDISLGVSYKLHNLGEGKLISYDLPAEPSAWQAFVASLVSLAEISAPCSVSDGRLRVIPLVRKSGGDGLFILNGSNRPVAADLLFNQEVCVSDLALSISGNDRSSRSEANKIVPATRFALEVPPCGVLPIAVRENERTTAAGALAAAASALTQGNELAAEALPTSSTSSGEAKWT